MSGGESYVVAAYLIFLALLLIYVGIMAVRLGRIERELGELNELASRRPSGPATSHEREPAA
jgi:hypothetical protein